MGKGSIGLPQIAGVLVGLLFFCLTSLWLGKPIIPSLETVYAKAVLPPPEPIPVVDAADETGEQVYQRICVACHQADGNGLPPAFPPLAGSEWVNGDAETPIRIVLAGLEGPLQVKGAQFAMAMPAQGGTLDDAQIAKVLTFVRSSFGNSAGAVEAAQVAAIREGLGGRGAWKATELTALRGGDSPAAEATPEAEAVPEGEATPGAEAAPEGETPDAEAEAQPEAAPEAGASAASIEAGKKLFMGVCFTCHGAAGDGNGPAGAALTPKPANFTDPQFWVGKNKAAIEKAIKLGGPAVGKSPLMAPFGGQFSDAQIGELADFVMSLKPGN